MSTKQIPTGPTVEKLKEQFRARSIPLENDFSELIDIADIGRKAVGLSPEHSANTRSGLALDVQDQLGIKVMPNAGIVVDENGVGLVPEQQFYAGMIMMFSGATVPAGWALCDGDEGTPDLRNRFVLGGVLGDKSASSSTVSGSGSSKTYTVNTNTKQTAISVTVNSHVLTSNQIPSHNHLGGEKYRDANDYINRGTVYGRKSNGYTNGYRWEWPASTYAGHGEAQVYTSNTGGSQGHGHGASATQNGHNHSVTITTPYYTLAFIMKL